MVVVNPERIYGYGYPDVNMVPSGCGCGGSNISNHRGPFVGLGSLPNEQGFLAVAAVIGTIWVLSKMNGRAFFVRKR